MRFPLIAGLFAILLWPLATCSILAADDEEEEDFPATLIVTADPLSPQEQLKKFHLPEGFEIQLVAAEPDVRKPLNLSFDARGWLYVTQSEEYPFPAPDEGPRRDVVKCLQKIGADGQPAQITTAVAGLSIPIGGVPYHRDVIHFSIPAIHRATDADGDGQCETSRVLYSGFGFKDTHGLTNSYTPWIDGWIYACHGYNNDTQTQGADGHVVKMNSGNTFRFRADGSRIEQFTHGQVNPFGIAFDPLGNLYTADCHSKPIYLLLRGGWYPSFTKPHDGLGFAPAMIGHAHGSTGIAGVAFYAADHFREEYRDTVFIGNPVTGRVNHDRLAAHGSTYQAVEQQDFIVCDDPWFRPVDIKLGPDGALYIADFYNAIVAHYEVPLTHPRRDRARGRIWRVVNKGRQADRLPPRPMPDLTRLKAADLIDLLGHPNLTVRMLVSDQIMSLARTRELDAALDACISNEQNDTKSATRRAHVLWLIERMRGLSDEQIDRLSRDGSRLVRVHLMKALAERADWNNSSRDLHALARRALHDEDAFVRRAAADAIGLHPHVDNLGSLLNLWTATPGDDTHLIHTIRMALRNQFLAPNMYQQAKPLVANDATAQERVADVSLGVHSQDSAAFLLDYLTHDKAAGDKLYDQWHEVSRYIADDRFDDMLRQAGRQAADNSQPQRVLTAVARGAQERGQKLDREFVENAERLLNQLLTADNQTTVKQAIELAKELRAQRTFDQLTPLARRDARFDKLRLAAIDACVACDASRALDLLTAIMADADDRIQVRQKAAAAMASIQQPDARQRLLAQLQSAPEPLAVEIARTLANTRQGGELLLREIDAGRASARLLQESSIALRLARQPALSEQVKELTVRLPPIDDALTALIEARREGFRASRASATQGREIFTKQCANCHQLAEQGAKIGPSLDGVGLRGVDRLLEDTLDPSRNVDHAFRTTVIATTGDNVITGLLLRQEGEVLVLAGPQGNEIRVPAGDIADKSTSSLSPMPANLCEQMPEKDYYDLLAFLLEQKQKTNKDK